MGKMKWIQTMIESGSYHAFKIMYTTAKQNGSTSFTWEGKPFQVLLAKSIIKLGDKAEKEYDKHIDACADAEYDSQFLDQ